MQIDPSATQPHMTYSRQFRRCNKADCPACGLGSPGHGPYWYAYWREGGRRRSRYIGKHLPPEIAVTHPPETPSEVLPRDSRCAPLRVRALGGFAVWRGTTPLPSADWAQRKVGMLFKCLLSAPRHRLHRERLAELLRPDVEPVRSAKYLRTTVHRLRRALGDSGYIQQDGQQLVLVPSPEDGKPEDWLDALTFERAAAGALAGRDAGALRAALALYGGEFLPDDPYDEWVATRREELRRHHLALLLRLAELREKDGVLGEAARCLRAVLACDPCHEPAARSLMRVQLGAGRQAEAVRTYRQLAQALERDLDLVPDLESEAQYQEVLARSGATFTRPCNLPTLLTSFIGREQELATLVQSLIKRGMSSMDVACRLLTVTGAGGCGKTRLAIELGHELRGRYDEGLWLVELAALAPEQAADPDLLARHTNAVLGLRSEPDQSALVTLMTFLQPRRILLILDNCEHLLAGSAAFVTAVLAQCAGVQIVVTSREALGVMGETVWRLPSLAVPAVLRQTGISVQEVGRYAAVRLLVERARLVRSDYALTIDNCLAVAEICAQLDGIPLALELAAARLGHLSAGDLAARLQDRFRLLATGNRAALPRHQTLRAVVDWSYDLLSTDEQALLRLLSVFAGGWTLNAVETICSGSRLGSAGVADLLVRLASKSLVQIEDAPETRARYSLLETIRQYAAHRLHEQAEEISTRNRHLAWCLELAETSAVALDGPDQLSCLNLLEAEHDNLRAALAWCTRAGGAVDPALRLAGALWLFWGYRGHWSEGRRWLSAALAREGGEAHARLHALRALGALAENQGDYRQARMAQTEYLMLARAAQNIGDVAHALNGLGNIARYENRLEEAAALYQETLALSERAGNSRGIARALHNLALIAQEAGDYARAIKLNEESLTHRRSLGDRLGIASTQYNLAICYRLVGEPRRATALFHMLLPQFEGFGDKWSIAAVHNEMGRIACDEQHYQAAATHLGVSLKGFQDLGDLAAILDVLRNWALVVAGQGDPGLAARILGAVDAGHTAGGHPLSPGPRELFAADIALVRRLLGADDIFAAEWAEGRGATLEGTIGCCYINLARAPRARG